ncbi:hypothetical protein CLOSTHATH_03277 [Hungatella hathewayi DSM 13479]|uniref:Uncharacterized protein n=1 Tax=Hungatella hathewayi DSM 13479 TaxID=566550 RepID=D3AI37_9FIRM|nr:hypothetical protein CLOSTHATH_03277 [Hungatella hathewayi DSM 13479]
MIKIFLLSLVRYIVSQMLTWLRLSKNCTAFVFQRLIEPFCLDFCTDET